MMKKKNKFRPFSRRLTRRIVLALFLTLSIFGFLIVASSWAVVELQCEEGYQHQLHGTVETIRCTLSDIHVAAVNAAPYVEEHLDQPEHLPAMMERVVRLNPRVRSCGISFVENYYPQKGRSYCPYACRHDDGRIETFDMGSKDASYLEEPWFHEALAADSGYWSKPFLDGYASTIPLVAYMLPIHDRQGRTVAIMGVDLSLDWLHGKLKQLDINMNQRDGKVAEEQKDRYKKESYSFILDSDGTYIVHPDRKLMLKENYFAKAKETPDTLDDHVGREMVAGKTGEYDIDDDGNDLYMNGFKVYALYEPIENINWSMAIIVPFLRMNLYSMAMNVVLIFLILLSILVVFIVSRSSIRRAAKPLNQLARSAGEVAQGHFDTPLPTIKHNDEIRQLRDSFENMQHSLTDYVAQLQTTAAQKASIENELKIAHDIQMAMLPKTFPPFPERQDINISARLTPAKAVGGDLFDFYIRDEKLFFCIGDVSGKGVPASLVMAVTRTLFRNVSAHTSEPQLIVKALNDVVAEDNETSMFVTLFVGVLDLTTRELCYCNAGHDAPLLVGSDVGLLPCDANLPVGVMPGWEFTLQTVATAPGTIIFLFTDGLNEAENATHAQFGDDRVLGVAQSLAAEGNCLPDELIDRMSAAVHDFVGDAEQSDDLTMLAVQLK